MRLHFTKHSKEKITKVKKAGFQVTKKQIQETVTNPLRLEDRQDGIFIATTLLDEKHVLRVVFRHGEHGIIIIITLYPGRRKNYEV